ncbi:MAG: hypothetical protein LDLANPLL_00154 [Turneriella sp.]|nr:hypothetical protein [Turneriella sp.]
MSPIDNLRPYFDVFFIFMLSFELSIPRELRTDGSYPDVATAM